MFFNFGILLVVMVGVSLNLEPAQNTGTMFIRQPDLLMAGLYWTIAVDMNITNYSVVIEKFIWEIESMKAVRLGSLDTEGAEIAKIIDDLIIKETEILTVHARQVEMQLDNVYRTLMPGGRRSRRQLLGVALAGVAAAVGINYLFGESSSHELTAINQRVNALDVQQAGILHLLSEQITYLKDSREREQRHDSDVRKIAQAMIELNAKIETVADHLRTITRNDRQFTLSLYTIQTNFREMGLTLQSIKDSIDNLEAAVAITALGRLSPHFLPPATLLQILKRVQPHLKQGSSFLTQLTIDRIYPFYDLCKVHLATMGSVIRLFVSMPIKQIFQIL